MLKKTELQIQKISFICKVIENILDNLLLDHIFLGNKLLNIKQVIQKEFKKHDILTIKNFVIDGYLVDDICHISQKNQVVHGNGDSDLIEEGILKIDLVGYKEGVFGDAARSYIIGNISEQKKNLVETSKKAFFDVLNFVKTGDYFYKIPKLIQNRITKNKFFTSELLGGHGIGEKLHEEPFIPNFFNDKIKEKYSVVLEEGIVFAIEPMVFLKSPNLFIEDKYLNNSNTIHVPISDSTKDNMIAHYENTVFFDKEGIKMISEF